jgi:release factor glutamine methyltransferase
LPTTSAMNNTCLEALNQAVNKFRSEGIDRPRTNAELLLGAVLNARKINLYLDRDRILTPQEVERFGQFIEERLSGKPVQYIIGGTEFFGLELKVNPSVLIPRPETETLVETVLENLRGFERPRIIDLGTGSGAIAISLAKNLTGSHVYATDVSSEALKVAQDNARRHAVLEQIQFLCGDLFEPLKGEKLAGEIDCVVSNPPYVSAEEFETLPKEVKDFEPIVALKTDEEGVFLHRKIIENSLGFLASGAMLALEVGVRQAGKVSELIRSQGSYEKTEIKKDLGGIERIVFARKA